MNKFTFTLLLSAFASASVMAQVPPKVVGTVTKVSGLATGAEVDNKLSNLVEGQNITEGERVQTSASGDVMMKFKNGCTIRLTPLQAITIREGLECKVLIASIVSTGPVIAGAGVSGFAVSNPGGAVALTIGGLAAYVNYRQRDNASGS